MPCEAIGPKRTPCHVPPSEAVQQKQPMCVIRRTLSDRQVNQYPVLVYEHGVLIDLPIAESPPDDAHWLLLLHRLGWRHVAGSPLRANRLAWHANMTVPYEWVVEKEFNPSGLSHR